MSTFLFNDIIFGPVQSRRLGVSLGINLLPVNRKLCTFDCIYCECGLNRANTDSSKLPEANEVIRLLSEKLQQMAIENKLPDVITFAGNGEPTLHPKFYEIVKQTIDIRNRFAPECEISVLSNATRVFDPKVFEALLLVDNNILKLDTASNLLLNKINRPETPLKIENIIEGLIKFNGRLIIQTLFCKGKINGDEFDNTTDEEVNKWIDVLQTIKPKSVMIYSISRDTPYEEIHKIGRNVLEQIGKKVIATGLKAEIS